MMTFPCIPSSIHRLVALSRLRLLALHRQRGIPETATPNKMVLTYFSTWPTRPQGHQVRDTLRRRRNLHQHRLLNTLIYHHQ